jgi:hypothetical protein
LVIGNSRDRSEGRIRFGALGSDGIDRGQFREPGFGRQHAAMRSGVRACGLSERDAPKKSPALRRGIESRPRGFPCAVSALPVRKRQPL